MSAADPNSGERGAGDEVAPTGPSSDHDAPVPATPPDAEAADSGEDDVEPEDMPAEGGTLQLMGSGLPTIPDVQLIEEVGRGGMGTVYRGRQEFIDREVAVKVLKRELTNSDYVQRFRREAKLLARMSHPAIVACLAAGETKDGLSYIVMELIKGPDLFHWLKDKDHLETEPALKLIRSLAQALAYAFEAGIIHRDIKTANVLLAPHRGAADDDPFPWDAKLVDLGLARPQEVDEQSSMAVTQTGVALGTPSCMSPEQFGDPDEIDFRSDIYGLGCVLFHVLTGRAAFPQKGLPNVFTTKMKPVPPDPREVAPALPGEVSQLVSKMLATKREDRHGSYQELLGEIESILAKRPSSAQTRAALPKLLGVLLIVIAVVSSIMHFGGDDLPDGAGRAAESKGMLGSVAPSGNESVAAGDAESVSLGAEAAPGDAPETADARPLSGLDPVDPLGPQLQVAQVDGPPPGTRGHSAGTEVELMAIASPGADGSPASLRWTLVSTHAEARPFLEDQFAGIGDVASCKLMLPRVRDQESYEIVLAVEARHAASAVTETLRIDVDSTSDARSITKDILLMDDERLIGWTPREDSARPFGGAEEYFGVQGRSTRGQASAESVALPAGDWILKGAFRALYRDNFRFMEVGFWIGCDPGPTRMLALNALIPVSESEAVYRLSTAEFQRDTTPLYGGTVHAATSGTGIANAEWPLDAEQDMSRAVKFTVTKDGAHLMIVVVGQERNPFESVLDSEPLELGLFVVGGLGEFRDFKLSPLERP